ncbi:MAG: DUF1858 domain-containing protein [Patescibacteria group bacterium]
MATVPEKKQKKRAPKRTKPSPAQFITERTYVAEAVIKYPESVAVFTKYGLHCVGCMGSQFDTIASGAAIHGINITHLLHDLNTHIAQTQRKRAGR